MKIIKIFQNLKIVNYHDDIVVKYSKIIKFFAWSRK